MIPADGTALLARLADLERRLALAEAQIEAQEGTLHAYGQAWAAIAPMPDPCRPALRLIPGGAR